MIALRTTLVIIAGWLAAWPHADLHAAQPECRQPAPLRLRVRFADEAARDALLESTVDHGLRLIDATTRRELWTAGSAGDVTQKVADMRSAFGSSFTALHLDADGVHDRIYAGDQSGRLWRFDLRTGAKPSGWMQAAVLADLGAAAGGRGFIAPPDVTRLQTADGRSWLSIAIGSANTGNGQSEQRFYVIRDSLGGEPPVQPLREADLELRASHATATEAAHGYYYSLGHAQVVARALTLNGITRFTVVAGNHNLLAGCSGGIRFNLTQASVGTVRASDGAVVHDNSGREHSGNPLQPLARQVPADAEVAITATADASGRQLCHVDSEALPDCFVDTRPRRVWWRREDAD